MTQSSVGFFPEKIRDLVFAEYDFSIAAAMFQRISDHENILTRIYSANRKSFYDKELFFKSVMRPTLSDRPTDIQEFLETKHAQILFGSVKDKLELILAENPGVLVRDVFDDAALMCFGNCLDVTKTFRIFDMDFMRTCEKIIDAEITVLRAFNNAASVFKTFNDEGTVSNPINLFVNYPSWLLVDSQERDDFLTGFAVMQKDTIFSERLMDLIHHFLIFAGCMVLKARFETFIFFKRKRLTIKHIVSKVSDIGYSFDDDDFDEILKFVKSNRGPLHDCVVSDLILLASSDAQLDAANPASGLDYERECLSAFQACGYQAELTKATGDFGADIIAQKDGLKYCVQCKRLARPVGVTAVQEVVAARAHYVCDYGLIISQSMPTAAALELAQSNNVRILTKEEIASLP